MFLKYSSLTNNSIELYLLLEIITVLINGTVLFAVASVEEIIGWSIRATCNVDVTLTGTVTLSCTSAPINNAKIKCLFIVNP